MFLDLVKIEGVPVPPHGVAESVQELDNLLGRGQSRDREGRERPRYLYDFNRFLLHALGPDELRPLLRFTRAKQDLETLLDIVHKVFGGIGIVQEILADGELSGLLMGGEGERFRRRIPGTARINRRSG